MSRNPELQDLLERAGLPPDAEVEELGMATPVHEDRLARGDAAARSADLEAILDNDFVALTLARPLPGLRRVDRSTPWPKVLVAQLEPGATWVFGNTTELDGELREAVVDTQATEALLRFDDVDGESYFFFQDGNVRPIRRARSNRQVPSLELAVPTLDELVGPEALEPWLRQGATERLAADDAMTRAAGAALVARHWVPPLGTAEQRLKQRLAGELVSPAQRFAAWARQLDGALVRQVAEATVGRVREVHRRLDHLIDDPPTDDAALATQARELFHAVAEVQAMATVVSAACRGPAGSDDDVTRARQPLDAALESLDRRLSDALPFWVRARGLAHDPWVSRMASTDPSSAAATIIEVARGGADHGGGRADD